MNKKMKKEHKIQNYLQDNKEKLIWNSYKNLLQRLQNFVNNQK